MMPAQSTESFFGRCPGDESKGFRYDLWWEGRKPGRTSVHGGRAWARAITDRWAAVPATPKPEETPSAGPRDAPMVHFVFIGSSLPKTAALCVESWKRHFSNVRMWDDDSVDRVLFPALAEAGSEGGRHRKLLADPGGPYRAAIAGGKFGFASDLLRYVVLFHFGGMYVDIDYYLLKNPPLDFWEECCRSVGLVTCASNTGVVEVNNGFILAVEPGNKILAECIRRIERYWRDEFLPRLLPGAAGLLLGGNNGTGVPGQSNAGHAVLAFLGGGVDDLADGAGSEATAVVARGAAERMGHMLPDAVIEHSGPGMFTRVLMCVLEDEEQIESEPSSSPAFLVLPATMFHPVPNTVMGLDASTISRWEEESRGEGKIRIDETMGLLSHYITDVTVAVHCWSRSWQ